MQMLLAQAAWAWHGNHMKTNMKPGMKVTVLNKFSDEIAEGIVAEVNTKSVILDNGDEFLFRHIARESVDAATIHLSIVGATL